LLTTALSPFDNEIEDIVESNVGAGAGGRNEVEDVGGAATGGGVGMEDVVSPMSGATLSPQSAGPDM